MAWSGLQYAMSSQDRTDFNYGREQTMYRLIAIAIACALAGAAHAAPSSNEQKLLNAILNKRHPDGKGVSSTSSSRGYYRGGNGQWRSR